MSQQHDLLRALRAAGRAGVHSHDCRIQLHIGDPSRRVADLVEQGYRIQSKIERRNGSHGVRYRLLPTATQRSTSPPRSGGAAVAKDGRPVRYPAQSMKQWSTQPDDREGWGRVREFDGSWWWVLTAPEPSQRELAA